MTTAFFTCDHNGNFNGFTVSGHSGHGFSGNDIVCAAISSSAIFAANLITDFIGAKADVCCDDAFISLRCKKVTKAVEPVLKGLFVHMRELSVQYPCNLRIIKVKTGGNNNA